MPELTRRSDPNAQQETWLIYYGDVRVGVIAERVGNPDSTPGWQWSCGFYPGSNLAERTSGLAESFDQARRAFEAAWRVFFANRTEADFEEYCRDRAFHAWKQGHVGGRPQAADARCRRPGHVLLWRCDRSQRHERPRLRCAHGARGRMKFVEPRPYADPEAAARKLVEIASTIEPVQNGRIFVELVNAPFLKAGGSPGEYRAGLDRAIAKGWLIQHDSGTYVKFTEAGAALFA